MLSNVIIETQGQQELHEGENDGREMGAGMKMLNTLRSLEVYNVLLVAAVWERGLPNQNGIERSKVIY